MLIGDTGNLNAVLIYDVPAIVAAAASIYAAKGAYRNHKKLEGIDRAVNQVSPTSPTLRETVEEVKEKITTPNDTPPVGEAVASLVESDKMGKTQAQGDPA